MMSATEESKTVEQFDDIRPKACVLRPGTRRTANTINGPHRDIQLPSTIQANGLRRFFIRQCRLGIELPQYTMT